MKNLLGIASIFNIIGMVIFFMLSFGILIGQIRDAYEVQYFAVFIVFLIGFIINLIVCIHFLDKT